MPKQRPIIKMKQSGSRRRGGGSLEEPAGTETGQNLANLMGSIVKESTTGKRYVEEGTEGQPGLTDVIGATGHEYSQNLQAVRHASPGGFIEGIAKLPDAPSMRAKGSRGHFDAGHA